MGIVSAAKAFFWESQDTKYVIALGDIMGWPDELLYHPIGQTETYWSTACKNEAERRSKL
jgi:hypothetical protein